MYKKKIENLYVACVYFHNEVKEKVELTYNFLVRLRHFDFKKEIKSMLSMFRYFYTFLATRKCLASMKIPFMS